MHQDFDIVFVIGYHRAAYSIAFLITHFSKTHKVAVLFMESSNEMEKKTGKYRQLFTEDFTHDIQILSFDDKVNTKILY